MLTAEEKIAAIERVRDDQGGTENRKLKKAQVIEALLDIRTWLIVLSIMLSKFDSDSLMRIVWLIVRTASIPNGGLSNCKLMSRCRDRSSLTTVARARSREHCCQGKQSPAVCCRFPF